MVKECNVILNNDAVTVVVYDGIRVQLPSIKRKAQTVFVDKRGSRYIVFIDLGRARYNHRYAAPYSFAPTKYN